MDEESGAAVREAVTFLWVWRNVLNSFAARKKMAQKRSLAKAFNDLYCFANTYESSDKTLGGTALYGLLPTDGNRWMCPECNKIHAPIACSVWSGLQYPRCCSTAEGHRLSHGIKTK